MFATQSLADIERSTFAPALLESCPTRIFLPNDRALEPQAQAVYQRFGLNARQIELLAVSAPKRDYYAQTARGNRLFELGLGPVALALCGSSSPDDQKLIDTCIAQPVPFPSAFLRAKGLSWAVELIDSTAATASPLPPPLPPANADATPSPPASPGAPDPDALFLDQPTDRAPGAARRTADLASVLALPHLAAPIEEETTLMTNRRMLFAACSAALVGMSTAVAAQGLTVFDPFNYQENLLSSVRALEQINNQVRQLQAQALMIARMDQNLQRLGTSIAPDLQRTLSQIQTRLHDGNGLALRVQGTEAAYARLFPRELAGTLSSDDVLRAAKTRWDEEHAGLQRAALIQAEIADANGIDTRLLDESMARSRSAAGALEAVQAGNELNALGVKQAVQLQSLLATHGRAGTIARARELATENEARQRFRTFVGTGNAYTRSQ